ncbi:MAG: glycosyltransferase [Cyanobacteria bacterium]|nr:glycosyltransferase [Cyanobacteriota bacterium]
MHLVLEQSPTPIYQRLIAGLTRALVGAGHRISLLDPTDFIAGSFAGSPAGSPDGSLTRLALGRVAEVGLLRSLFWDRLDSLEADALIIVSPISLLAGFELGRGRFLYEQAKAPLVFLHYEDCLGTHPSRQRIEAALGSYIASAARSHHFCLEPRNARELGHLKLATSPLFAIGEGTYEPPAGAPLRREVCFIGHVHPGFDWGDQPPELASELQAEIRRRLHHFDHPLEPAALAYAQRCCGPESSPLQRLAAKAFYRSLAHCHSLEFRGEVLQRLGDRRLDLYGPEAERLCASWPAPAPAFGLRRGHPATESVAASAAVYRSSLISLNITALQFDQAVSNRILDVAAAGGFPLTDWKDELGAITAVAEAISYRSLEELRHKIDYYCHPDHRAERLEIATTLQREVRERGDYGALAQAIGAVLADLAVPGGRPT